jgi:hypothetical protein
MFELKQILGDDFRDDILEETLLYYDLNIPNSIKWLLGALIC